MKASFSFLPTRDDYINYVSCLIKNEVTGKERKALFILGVITSLFGAVCIILNSVESGVFLFALGIFFCIYFKVFYPVFQKSKAAAFYDSHGEKMFSVSFVFYDEEFEIISDRYKLRCPYEMIYKIVEDDKIFLLYSGEGEINYFPKRVVGEDSEIIKLLKEKNKSV